MNWRKTGSLLLLMVGWFVIGWLAHGLLQSSTSSGNPELALIAQAGQAITTQSFKPPSSARLLTYAGIRGMLSGLDDKYAAFFDPDLAARNRDALRGADASLGVHGGYEDGTYTVTYALPDLPAARAGLLPGDAILTIDSWPVNQAHSDSEVVAMLRGPISSTAHLTVRRGPRILTFDIPRQTVQEVTTQTLGSDIAYIRLDRFSEKTPTLMQQAVSQLLADQPRGLILDLRRNGGGLMDATQQVLDLFLDEGLAFYARTKDGQLIPYKTTSGSPAEKIPLVILIGPGTYSAPETLAAAIAERKRGTLMGETTYGKGAIVSTFELFDGSALRLTVAQWLSPVLQASYEGRGLSPDIRVQSDLDSTDDQALRAAVDYLQSTVK